MLAEAFVAVADDIEVAHLAETMISRHGESAGRAAAERVNAMIDRGDFVARDIWARVVQAIHQLQRGGLPPNC
jgi:hypothetical protein